MIIDDIKKANIVAIKERNVNARTIYSILMNKALMKTVEKREKSEEFNDADMLSIIQKTLKELVEEREGFEKANKIEEVNNLKSQYDLISKFLPKQMSEAQIKLEISKLDDKTIGNVMKHFKQNFEGQCDMKLVKSILDNK